MTDRQRTHGHDCWSWGPKHYECAVGRVIRDEALMKRALEALESAVAEIERLREALEDIRDRSLIDLVMRSDRLELIGLLSDIYQIADSEL